MFRYDTPAGLAEYVTDKENSQEPCLLQRQGGNDPATSTKLGRK
jgi:hypothetical protein